MAQGAVAKSLNTRKIIVQRWIARYEKFGIDGLSMKSGTYTGNFKVHVIEYIHENNMSLFQDAVHFGIPSDSTIGRWERIYWEEDSEALCNENRGRKVKQMKDKFKKTKEDNQVNEDLIAEVQRLRMENEYLKKLNTLVQAKEKSAKNAK